MVIEYKQLEHSYNISHVQLGDTNKQSPPLGTGCLMAGHFRPILTLLVTIQHYLSKKWLVGPGPRAKTSPLLNFLRFLLSLLYYGMHLTEGTNNLYDTIYL